MSTASIIDTIVIKEAEQAEVFADAVEQASQSPLGYRNTPVRMVRDREEFLELMRKRKKLYG